MTQYDIMSLDKALRIFGKEITSAALELDIPPDEIGPRFIGAIEDIEEWEDLMQYHGDFIRAGKALEYRVGGVQYFFEREYKHPRSTDCI